MAESASIFILATDNHAYLSLRLAVMPAVRERIKQQDLGDEMVAGTATCLEWRGLSMMSIAVPVRVEVHPRFAALEPLTKEFVRNLVIQERLDGVHKCDSAHRWEGLAYIPIPRKLADPQTPTIVAWQAATFEVSPTGHLHGMDKPLRAVCPVWARQISKIRVSSSRLEGV